MKRVLIFSALLALASIGFAGVAKADTTVADGVFYTFTNSGSDGSGGFFVSVEIETAGAGDAGTLSVFAVQFFSGGKSATGASIDASLSSANTAGWSVAGPGNVNQCGSGNLPFICSSGPGISVPGGTFTFVFDVTGLGSAPTDGAIQAFQGTPLSISNPVGIFSPPTTTPEPASMLLLGLGLAGVPFLRRKRS